MSIEAAIIGVDPSGKPVVLKPPLWQIAIALVGVCDEAALGPAQEHEDSSLDVIALSPECVQAIAESLDSPAKNDMLYDVLLSDEDIQTQTSSYVAEERALFEADVRRFITQASRWFATAATEQWNVTLEVSI